MVKPNFHIKLPRVFPFNKNQQADETLFHSKTTFQNVAFAESWEFKTHEALFPTVTKNSFISQDFLFVYLLFLMKSSKLSTEEIKTCFMKAYAFDPSFSSLFNLQMLYQLSYKILKLDYSLDRDSSAPRCLIEDFFSCFSQLHLQTFNERSVSVCPLFRLFYEKSSNFLMPLITPSYDDVFCRTLIRKTEPSSFFYEKYLESLDFSSFSKNTSEEMSKSKTLSHEDFTLKFPNLPSYFKGPAIRILPPNLAAMYFDTLLATYQYFIFEHAENITYPSLSLEILFTGSLLDTPAISGAKFSQIAALKLKNFYALGSFLTTPSLSISLISAHLELLASSFLERGASTEQQEQFKLEQYVYLLDGLTFLASIGHLTDNMLPFPQQQNASLFLNIESLLEQLIGYKS